MSSFQVDGLISGLRTTDIISQLMSLERRPIIALQTKQSTIQKRTDALKDVATRLTSLRATLDKLYLSSTFGAKRAATDTLSTAQPFVTATASADAAVGSFKVEVEQLATSTVVTSPTAIGKPVDVTLPLTEAGFATTPTAGFFTINGEKITIDDPATVTLDGGAGSVVALINSKSATTGVTASVVDNKLVLASASTINLGSGADTSNFLTAAKVLAAPDAVVDGSHQLASTSGVGGTLASANLEDARLATALGATTGKFRINGVEFSYDARTDSLNKVISRINSSSAGVSAAYDAQSDRFVLTAKATGGVSVALEDVEGSFLAAAGVLDPAAQRLGQNARYSVDTGTGKQTLYSTSNTVSGAVPGITLTLRKAEVGTTVTVTVEQDTAVAVQAVKAFVDQYNSTVAFIREKTSYDAANKTGQILLGDSTAQAIEPRLRSLLFSVVAGADGKLNKLADLGISTGAIGSKVGATETLVLDEAKLTAALQDNPLAVARVFIPEAPTVLLKAGGTGSISTTAYSGSGTARAGTYSITSDGAGNLTSVFTPIGGTAEAAVTGTIAAGGMNSTLLSGLTLHARDPLVAGTDVVEVLTGDGVASRLRSYLDSLVGGNGTLTTRRESGQEEIYRLGRQIALKEDLLTEKELRLVQRFAALESALSRLQSQSSQLASALGGLANNQGG